MEEKDVRNVIWLQVCEFVYSMKVCFSDKRNWNVLAQNPAWNLLFACKRAALLWWHANWFICPKWRPHLCFDFVHSILAKKRRCQVNLGRFETNFSLARSCWLLFLKLEFVFFFFFVYCSKLSVCMPTNLLLLMQQDEKVYKQKSKSEEIKITTTNECLFVL